MTEAVLRLVLRSLAIALVIAAILDPVFTRVTNERAIVAVQRAEDLDDATAAAVRRTLEDRFDVIDGPFAAAAATVVIGPRQVQTGIPSPGPVFAVVDTNAQAALSILVFFPPRTAALDAALPLNIGLGVPVGSAGPLALSAVHEGVTLDSISVTLDSIAGTVAGAQRLVESALTIVPTTVGVWPLRIRAVLTSTGVTAEYDLVVEVTDQRSAVLFFDRRPSYQSTFVRRAVEADARFRVTHRVLTAREASRGTGSPPSSLADAAALDVFDVVVIGAPDALTVADRAAVDRFLRERGGSVVLLQDSLSNATPLRALTGVPSWRDVRGSYDARTLTEAEVRLPVSRIAVPTARPAGSRILVVATVAGAERATMVPALWSSSVGQGQLFVSGLLDQWRFRDEPGVEFSQFWPAVIAEAASTVIEPIEPVSVPQLVTTGALVPLTFWLRDGAGTGALPPVVVVSDSGRRVDSLPVIADPRADRWHALWRVPSTPGAFELQFTAGLSTRRVPGLAVPAIRRDGALDPARRLRWITASGGVEVGPDDIESLPGAISRAIGSPAQQLPWYPMRSPWWIVPFALLLGAEWWLRRRQALP